MQLLYYNRGLAYANIGEYQLAIRDYDKVIELDPEHAEAYCFRGLAYDNLGDYRQAIGDYDKAIESDPEVRSGLYQPWSCLC